jgi:hypothetical protein
MAHTYERTFAPSEEVSEFAASKLGISVELAIFTHYLHVTRAPRKPSGNRALVDFSDTGVQIDYVKMLSTATRRTLMSSSCALMRT